MRIVIDEYNLQTYTDAILVTDDISFIRARQLLLEYKISGQGNKLIVVKSYPYSSWFTDIQKEQNISVNHILPSRILLDKFEGIDIDPELEEQEIINLDLLGDTIEPTEMSIINKFIGPFLLDKSSFIENLYQFTNFLSNPPSKFKTCKYLHNKWIKYIDKLDYHSELLEAIKKRLTIRDTQFCQVLTQLIYVSKSKLLLNEFLHDNRDFIEKVLKRPIKELSDFLSESHFKISHSDHYEFRIQKFFKSVYKQDRNSFFDEESDYKASLLAFLSVTRSISKKEKDFILKKYIKIIDPVLEEQIRFLIKPELSCPPNLNGLTLLEQIDRMQKWSVETYIPFKFFLDNNPNEEDIKIIENYVNIYSDWLYSTYSNIVQNGIKTIYNIVGYIKEELIDARVIWLIIDGFPSAYSEIIKSILKKNGINKIDEKYLFAALPTITEIGIPTQLCGMTPQSNGYSLVREEALRKSFPSKKVVYRNRIKTFDEALESDFDICCLHWQEIDDFLHKEDKDIEGRRIDEIEVLVNKRIQQISNIIRSISDKRTKLVISTDHGCTKCLSPGNSIKNSSLVDACKGNQKERCLEIKGPVSNAKLDEAEIYYLDKARSSNTSDWVVAKGYRYFGKFDYGYRHGGLTPEETIVPFLTCEILQNEVLPLKMIFIGLNALQIGYTEVMKFQIRNDNEFSIQLHKIAVNEDPNFKVEFQELIPSLSPKTLEGKIKFPKSTIIKEGKSNINITLTYSVLGETYNQELTLRIPIRSTGNESLDELIK